MMDSDDEVWTKPLAVGCEEKSSVSGTTSVPLVL